jgi:iron-sulfur cluster repair protein YtfE (RIC family)
MAPMSGQETIGRDTRADWIIMRAVHDAFRRDLDTMIEMARRGTAPRGRWTVFRDQLTFHHTGEDEALWPAVRAKLAGNADGLALMEAMEEEHSLIDPLLAAVDDALALDAAGPRVSDLLTRLQATLLGHLAHEESAALPLVSSLLTQEELTAINKQFRKLGGLRQAAVMFPWALSAAAPQTRDQVLRLLPPPARLLYAFVWLPRYTRRAAAFDPA